MYGRVPVYSRAIAGFLALWWWLSMSLWLVLACIRAALVNVSLVRRGPLWRLDRHMEAVERERPSRYEVIITDDENRAGQAKWTHLRPAEPARGGELLRPVSTGTGSEETPRLLRPTEPGE